MSDHPRADGPVRPSPTDHFPLTPARRIETLERVRRAFDAVPRNTTTFDSDALDRVYNRFVDLGGALSVFGLTFPEPDPSDHEAALAVDLLVRSSLASSPQAQINRFKAGISPAIDTTTAVALTEHSEQIRDAAREMGKWSDARFERVRAAAEAMVSAALVPGSAGRPTLPQPPPPAGSLAITGNPFARLRDAVRTVFAVCQMRDAGCPPPDAVRQVEATDDARRAAEPEARELGRARGISVERVECALMLVKRVFTGYGPVARGTTMAQWYPVNPFGMQYVGVSGLEDELERLAALTCGSSHPPRPETQPQTAASATTATSPNVESNEGKPRSIPPLPKSKRTTQRGGGRPKLIAALTKHHQYENGSCQNFEPIGNNKLASLARVVPATASAFFKKEFRGYAPYAKQCERPTEFIATLKMLNGEFSPHHLYGRRPPGEDNRDDD